jgi:uncharacterized protein (TIGR02391 family)
VALDREWIIGYLQEAVDLVEQIEDPQGTYVGKREATAEFKRRMPQVVRVLVKADEYAAKAFTGSAPSDYWPGTREALEQGIYTLKSQEKIAQALGPPPGPRMRADGLHTHVWDPAKSLWASNHRAQAVQMAAVSVNAMLQDKLGRRDISETDLVRQAFSKDEPKEGAPRLRLMADDGSKTYRSIHEGAASFGAGCFMALRNPLAHDPQDELGEQEALEQLAAFSILARWIEQARVDDAIPVEDIE